MMMRKTLIAASLAIGAVFAAASVANASTVLGFTAQYAPGNWTTSLTGVPPGGAGPVGATNDGTTLTLVGGDDGGCTSGPCQITYTLTNGTPGPEQHLKFHWSYSTTDGGLGGDTGPAFDPFGYIVNGVFTQLTGNADPGVIQSGDVVVSLAVGSQFGWYIDCTDCIAGNSTAVITDFAAVPEPGSLALLGLGLAGFAGLRRRRLA